MLTKHVSTALLGLLAALVLTDHLALWMVYAIALAMGIATAFRLPAATSMIPQVVAREQLSAANGMMMGMRQLSMFAGPLLAGGLIALFGDAASGAVRDAQGLGLAFLFDAASFALSAWTLAQVKLRAQPATLQASRVPVLQAVAEGLRYCWNDRSLRVCFSYWAAVAFFVQGPVQVAMPVLADQVGHGAGAFGLLVGVHGAGTLLGIAVSGARPNLRIRNLGLTMLALDAAVGLLFMPLGAIGSLWQGMLLLLTIGVLSGFLQVTVYSWLQRHVAPAMLGRSMGLFMFNFMGIAPIAAALAGWLMRSMGVAQLFAGCGALLIVIVGLAYLLSDMRALADPKTA
jgi:MFS family permease